MDASFGRDIISWLFMLVLDVSGRMQPAFFRKVFFLRKILFISICAVWILVFDVK